ncbi:hypothetical protein [Actinophytocola sediminis]
MKSRKFLTDKSSIYDIWSNALDIRTFTLETVDDGEGSVYAVGMSITRPCGGQEVVTFRRDPTSGFATLANTVSPEMALARFEHVMPMRLVWTDDEKSDIGLRQ